MVKVGDKIKFINEDLTGEVLEVKPKTILVQTSDGFDYEVSPSEIIVVNNDDNIEFIEIPNHENKYKPKINPSLNKGFFNKYLTKYKFEQVVEIDLHLEELVEFPNKLEDWQKLYTQLTHVKKCLQAAMDNRVTRIIFIHGKGTGVLKAELINLLANFDYLTYKDADFRTYGGGAIEVFLKF